MDKQLRPGRIRASWSVQCGVCGCIEDLGTPNDAATNEAMARGWHKTVKYWWVCPACYWDGKHLPLKQQIKESKS